MNIHNVRNKEKLRQRLHEEFAAYLDQKGMRRTAGRFLILDKCVDQRVHFDVQHLYDAVRDEYSVSLASVYKTVELLCECNILRKHYLRENQAAYEIAGEEHLHLICLLCGAVSVMKADQLLESQDTMLRNMIANGRYRSFCPSFITANVYGLCGDCKARS